MHQASFGDTLGTHLCRLAQRRQLGCPDIAQNLFSRIQVTLGGISLCHGMSFPGWDCIVRV
jgi:hypothetical protein